MKITKKVKVDRKKIKQAINKLGKSACEMSEEMGFERGYLSKYVRENDKSRASEMPESSYKMFLMMYGIDIKADEPVAQPKKEKSDNVEFGDEFFDKLYHTVYRAMRDALNGEGSV